jgi:hypothetical protein
MITQKKKASRVFRKFTRSELTWYAKTTFGMQRKWFGFEPDFLFERRILKMIYNR